LKINDEDTVGLSVDEAVAKIRGEKGTAVKLSIVHNILRLLKMFLLLERF
jgi:C-terminal processing protease CtpA/Prc